MTVDFLYITSMLVAARYALAFLFLCIFVWFAYGTYEKFKKEEVIDPKKVIKAILAFIALIMTWTFLSSGIVSPRGEINVPFKARPLSESVEIVTPPDRTEKLEGFTPLKKD